MLPRSVTNVDTGILGGTFVPCQAWTTTFYDTKIVGRVNALVGGWGNAGGGFTFIIMLGLYNRLRDDGLSAHKAWRASFAIIPVPILLCVALITLVFGTDHPNGKWADRHKPVTLLTDAQDTSLQPGSQPLSAGDIGRDEKKEEKTVDVAIHTIAAQEVDDHHGHFGTTFSPARRRFAEIFDGSCRTGTDSEGKPKSNLADCERSSTQPVDVATGLGVHESVMAFFASFC